MTQKTVQDRAWDALVAEWAAEGLIIPDSGMKAARASVEDTLFFQRRVLNLACRDLMDAIWASPAGSRLWRFLDWAARQFWF